MTARVVASDALLVLAVLVVLASSVGILVMRDACDRLHYVTPISLVAPLLIALAVGLRSGWSFSTGQAWLTLMLLVLSGPVLAHATIRAARIRQAGDWRGGRGEVRGTPGDEGRGRS